MTTVQRRTDHVLVVEGTREDGYTYSIECLVPGGQHGWEECGRDHADDLAAYRAASFQHQPDDECDAGVDCECDWCDGDELVLLSADGPDGTGADAIAYDRGAGRWLVDDDWDTDGGLFLEYVGPVTSCIEQPTEASSHG